MTGPMTGTRFPTSGRFAVATKSPLTGILLTTTSSGFWGVELKRTGHDGIVFEGKAERPDAIIERITPQSLQEVIQALWGIDENCLRSLRVYKHEAFVREEARLVPIMRHKSFVSSNRQPALSESLNAEL